MPFLRGIAGIIKHFDYSILTFFNSFATHSWYFDNFVRFISDSQIIKSGLLVSLLWWFWFRPADDQQKREVREKIISALIAALVALLLARFLALLLPFRARPIADVALGFKSPLGVSGNPLMGWSSFPSDHAVLFYSVATSILYISKRLGWVVFPYVFIIICLPRIYLGVHYPTDILVGAPIGMGVAWLFNRKRVRDFVAVPSLEWAHKSPSCFYAVFFLMSYEIAELFDQTRLLAKFVYIVIKHLFNK